MICELAPAKINLTLEILGKRNDGYHNLASVMQTIDICDVLNFWENNWIQVAPDYNGLPKFDSFLNTNSNYIFDNLVFRAAELLKRETSYPGGAVIQLKKAIPSAAGLGGGSSDAAATLRGLNRLWGLGLSNEQLADVGAKLGSDVPFFVYGGTCIVEGRGEKVRPISPLSLKWVVLLIPPINIEHKTATLYSHVTRENYSSGDKSYSFIDYLNGNHQLFLSLLCNVFEEVYPKLFDDYDSYIDGFRRAGAAPVHLAGSGPALYYITDNVNNARKIADKLANSRSRIYLCRTIP
ncbi:MAG: 4-(cytidine 5'-diphospho)-2-C-methyl-D-erythritol kinase [Actinobacteria bacterium]|nr:4-(cytidine 5'-diphospho)-2-C-methyl-D-erythritol kinase [Actinomycetota bacterium]